MSAEKLTKSDLRYCRQVWEREVVPSVEAETYDGPTAIVTSIGYVDVWRDGAVTAFGRELARVSDAADRYLSALFAGDDPHEATRTMLEG